MAAKAGTRELVRYEVMDGVAVLTLDDPPANTYSYEMMQQLDEAILKARMDAKVQVMLLRGAGEGLNAFARARTSQCSQRRIPSTNIIFASCRMRRCAASSKLRSW